MVYQNDDFLLKVLQRPGVFFSVDGLYCMPQEDLQSECANDDYKDGELPKIF